MANDGRKDDSGKLPMDLLPVEAKRGLAAVLAHGAKKYGAHNWRKGMHWTRLIASTYRHLDSFANGEDIDPDSGLPHIDCAQAGLAFLSTYQKTATGIDDRYRSPSITSSSLLEVNPKYHTVAPLSPAIDLETRVVSITDAPDHRNKNGGPP